MRPYLELMRPANVLTALADVIAGFAIVGLVHAAALPWLLASTACLYAGGVVLNDVFDRRLDAVERPERPIPSGRVAAARAAWLGALLLAAGVGFSAGSGGVSVATAGAIALLVVTYDAAAKPHAVLGPATVASCRALNLWLGMTAAPAVAAAHWPLVLLPFVYIVAVTAVSRGEVHGGARGIAALALVTVTGVVLTLAAITLRGTASLGDGGIDAVSMRLWPLLFVLLFAWRVVPPFWRATFTLSPGAMRAAVKAGVLSLVALDATLAATYAGPLYGLALLALGVAASRLARLFAVT
jgi:4-hydroxybenzoate polyprenyltransferase